MLDSMRSRLTLWYTGVLALVLVTFAVATYIYLARAARARTDQSLADTASSLVSNFVAELNEEDHTIDDDAREVTHGFQFSDRQAIIFDQTGRVVAASDAPADTNARRAWPGPTMLAQSLTGTLEAARASGRTFATIRGQEREDIRVFASLVKNHRGDFVVVILQPLHDQYEALGQVRRALYVAVPLALVLASLGGYFLARKSLAPVVAMGARAARIGAANLGERLPVTNEHSELGRLACIFNELLARLDLSFEQQRRFMADASHELRTPVAIVCGESEVALSQAVRSAEEYRESLSILHDEGRRLTRIVEDLFMLARADAGQYQPDFMPFYLDEAVSECVRAVRSLAVRHELELDYRHDGEEMLFRGDEVLIRRMIFNLLDNAIKYTPTGGLVRVVLGRAPGFYTISIEDTGAGIPNASQPHIFERFYRVDRARSHNGDARGSGAGLGLSIAAWVAELHGGHIRLAASNQHGSLFVISLPISLPGSAGLPAR